MDISEDKEGDVAILGPSEGLNTQTSPKLEQKLIALLERKVRLVVVDMKGVDYVSSAALRVLLMVTRRLVRAGGRLVLCALREEVRKVFAISGFDRDFTLVDTRAEAVALAAATPLPPAKPEPAKKAKKGEAKAPPPAAPEPPAAAPPPNPVARSAAVALATGETAEPPWVKWPAAAASDALKGVVLGLLGR